MTSPSTIEVKVVFDASSRGRRGPARVIPHTRTAGARGWHVLGFFHLLIAASLYYGIWWRVDPFLYMTLMLKTPMEMDLGAAAGIFGVPGAAQGRNPVASPAPPSARTAQVVIGSATYGWLTLSSASACALSLAAGAAVGRVRGTRWRRFVLLSAVFIALGLALWAFLEWRAFGRAYPPNHLRYWMGGAWLLSLAVGLLLGRYARGMTKFAAFALILGGSGTVVAILLGAGYEAIEPEYAKGAALTTAFAFHSAYGWLMLPLLRWVR